jgi:hypothetical protein
MCFHLLRILQTDVVRVHKLAAETPYIKLIIRHGPLDKCPIAQYEDLALAYLAAQEGSEERDKLERRYGKANIRRLVAAYEEEKANMEWLKKSATMCPGCQCYVEKTRGCNHVRDYQINLPNAPDSFADDMLEVHAALLLPLWTKVEP